MHKKIVTFLRILLGVAAIYVLAGIGCSVDPGSVCKALGGIFLNPALNSVLLPLILGAFLLTVYGMAIKHLFFDTHKFSPLLKGFFIVSSVLVVVIMCFLYTNQ